MEALRNSYQRAGKQPLVNVAANLGILALWLWLFRPVYPYLATIFTRQEFRTNQIVLLAVLVLIAMQMRRGQFHLSIGDLPHVHLPGLALALTGSVAFVAAEHWLDINTLSATLFGLASYGLLGLWMLPDRWRQGLPAALLLVGVLPFGEHMDTFIGYPLRLLTARMVSQGLAALGIHNLGVDTILVFENGLSQVDSPCSGVKSLWTGSLFLLAATWIDHRPVNRRWLLVAIGFVFLLMAANLARVAVLVVVGEVAGWRLLAELLHVPLGVIGFAVACAAALGLLRWTGAMQDESLAAASGALWRPRWLAPALAIALAALVLVYTPRPQAAASASLAWKFPPELVAEEWPLKPGEIRWLTNQGAYPVTAARWHFEWRGLSGSLLFVTSDTWRAQHRPERCFSVYGLETQASRLYMAANDFPLRWLALGTSHAPDPAYSAGYWLQSSQQVTDDYAVRIWDDLSPRPQIWVLATVLFDSPVNPDEVEVQSLILALRAAVQNSLEGK